MLNLYEYGRVTKSHKTLSSLLLQGMHRDIRKEIVRTAILTNLVTDPVHCARLKCALTESCENMTR